MLEAVPPRYPAPDAALRAKFKRVFAGTGTKREVAHVVALLKQVRKAAESKT